MKYCGLKILEIQGRSPSQIALSSSADIPWVCAAFSAVPTGRISWPQAGESLPAALPWCDQHPLLPECAAASSEIPRGAEHVVFTMFFLCPDLAMLLFCLLVVCPQLRRARAAVGHQEHEAASG